MVLDAKSLDKKIRQAGVLIINAEKRLDEDPLKARYGLERAERLLERMY